MKAFSAQAKTLAIFTLVTLATGLYKLIASAVELDWSRLSEVIGWLVLVVLIGIGTFGALRMTNRTWRPFFLVGLFWLMPALSFRGSALVWDLSASPELWFGATEPALGEAILRVDVLSLTMTVVTLVLFFRYARKANQQS